MSLAANEHDGLETHATEPGFDAWQALSEGGWALIETYVENGRRFLVARRHTRIGDTHALTLLETRALSLRGRGESYKVMASELRLSVASAHRLLRIGIQKLGIRNEFELPFLLEACAQTAAQKPRG